MLPAAEETFAHGAAEFIGPIQQPEIAEELPAPANPDNAGPDDQNAGGQADAPPGGWIGGPPPGEPAPALPPGAAGNLPANGGAQPLQIDNLVDPNAGANLEANPNPEGQPNAQQPNPEQQNAAGQEPVALRVVNNLEGGADREIAGDPAGAQAVGQAVARPPGAPNVQPPTNLAPADALANPDGLLQPNNLIQGNL
jgi:hypothetical protein